MRTKRFTRPDAQAMTVAQIISNPRRANRLNLCDETDFDNAAYGLFRARSELEQLMLLDDRVAHAARITGLSEAAVNRLVAALPTVWPGGKFALQVRGTADRRRATPEAGVPDERDENA